MTQPEEQSVDEREAARQRMNMDYRVDLVLPEPEPDPDEQPVDGE